ncbi:MAG: ABC transporter permease [Deltaproteobacteria bacterium]|nr:MAG: ABC transporter permease [Deltaproteobacteria bacterium]
MKKIFVLMTKEWKLFFYTPFALVIVPLFLVLCGTYYYSSLDRYLNLTDPNQTLKAVSTVNITTHLIIPFLQNLLNIFIFITPIITMRSFSEEKKLGSYDLLISYPIHPLEIFLGKFFGTLTLSLGLLLMSFIFVGFTILKGDVFIPQVASAYLGLFLFILFYNAVGVFASLLTENQIVAALIGYGVFFSTILFQWLAYVSGAPWDQFFQTFFSFLISRVLGRA